jgi:DNA invertase Pin-like site-specific DNA recombinase
MKKVVIYYRLSKQGKRLKGLGLEAQQLICNHYFNNGEYTIVKEFTETKSGKNIEDREQLKEALKYCAENSDCYLACAKLDRLSRCVDDVLLIYKQLKTKLLFADIPGTPDKFTITLYGAFAEREREMIALRTSQALNAKIKIEGTWQKGNPQFLDGTAQKKSIETKQRNARNNENTIRAMDVICDKVKAGLSFNAISISLNQNKFRTPKNKEFSPVQVKRIYDKYCPA